MESLKKLLVTPTTPILRVIGQINQTGLQFALVVDDESRLIGTVTDGDVRRGLLKGISLQDSVSSVMNRDPIKASATECRKDILQKMRTQRLRYVPVVDAENRLTRVEALDELAKLARFSNRVVLMAGGQGTRLRPLTDQFPKPLLTVGDRPILETTINHFIENGFSNFYISVNYKSDMIENYFGDGSQWGVDIKYLRETEVLGTAGALSLLPETPTEPLLVMNGDLLTKVNFSHLLEFHQERSAVATLGVRTYDFQVPYGVVNLDRENVLGIDEKPTQSFFINAGIYALNPSILAMIPKGGRVDMPTLFSDLIRNGKKVAAFPVREYWLDIGRIADFERANFEFGGIFGH